MYHREGLSYVESLHLAAFLLASGRLVLASAVPKENNRAVYFVFRDPDNQIMQLEREFKADAPAPAASLFQALVQLRTLAKSVTESLDREGMRVSSR